MNLPSFKESLLANPYRDWVLILSISLTFLVAAAVIDARFFLSATEPAPAPVSARATFDKEALARAVAALKEKEKAFGGR